MNAYMTFTKLFMTTFGNKNDQGSLLSKETNVDFCAGNKSSLNVTPMKTKLNEVQVRI